MNFLSLDSPVGKFLSKAFDLGLLNILFLMTCIPIVTIGASICAMYKVTLAMAKNEEGPIVSMYWKGFKENLKNGIMFWCISAFIYLFLIIDLYYCYNGYLPGVNKLMMVGLALVAAIVWMVTDWMYAWQAKFINRPKEVFHNAKLFTLRYILVSIIFCAANGIWLYFMIFYPQLWIVAILFGWSVPSFIKAKFYRSKLQIFEDMVLKEENDAKNGN